MNLKYSKSQIKDAEQTIRRILKEWDVSTLDALLKGISAMSMILVFLNEDEESFLKFREKVEQLPEPEQLSIQDGIIFYVDFIEKFKQYEKERKDFKFGE